MRVSLNPDPNHFILKYLDRYIGDDGYAMKEYSARPAYFVFNKVIVFPTGARVEFTYLEDISVVENWQGSQITAAYLDEGTHYGEFSFNYIRTRLRSQSKYKSFMRVSLNPDPNHFILKYLDRYIGDDGFARKEDAGRTAYFIFNKGELVTSWDYNALLEQYPTQKPRTYTFIPSSLS